MVEIRHLLHPNGDAEPHGLVQNVDHENFDAELIAADQQGQGERRGEDPEEEEEDDFFSFGFGTWGPGLLRIPIILGVEALISGRILHDETPAWFIITLWILLTIPILLSGEYEYYFPTYHPYIQTSICRSIIESFSCMEFTRYSIWWIHFYST